MRHPHRWLVPLALVAAIHEGWAPPARAQTSIVRDGSLGPARQEALGATGTMLRGGTPYNRVAIPETQGLRAGSNVFHSFSDFRVGRGDAAVFTVAAPTANVVSRVTGRIPSVIQGLLALEAGTAGGSPNLFLVNPAGVVFAAGAIVDVPGAFHASTADHLRLQDGIVHADPSRASSFTTADVVAFGFLPGNAGRVEVQPGALVATSQRPLSLTGSSIAITGGTVQTQGGGAIRLAATGPAAVEVPLVGDLGRLEGSLAVTGGGLVATGSGPTAAAGEIVASAATVLVANGGAILSETRSGADSGPVIVRARDVLLDGGPSAQRSTTIASRVQEGAGNAAAVDVAAEASVRVARGASISAVTRGAGRAGEIRIGAGSVAIETTGQVSASTHGAGAAGAVRIVADEIVLDGGLAPDAATGVFAQSAVEGGGRGGEVLLRSSGKVEILRTAQVSVATRSAAEGGSIRVEAATLSMRQGGQISGRASAAGNGGSVEVQADTIDLRGDPQDRTPSTGISNDTEGTGNAGDVRVTARSLTVRDSAWISSNSSSAGNGGTVQIVAQDVTLDDNRPTATVAAGVVATASDVGQAGRIQVDVAGTLAMAGGSQVSTNTSGSGAAGDVTINAGHLLIDDSRNTRQVTGIGSVSRGGPAGNVRVKATGAVTLLRGAKITSDTGSASNAGSVVVEAQDITVDGLLEDGSGGIATFISSDALQRTGAAGQVSVTATRNLHLRGGGMISSRAHAAGDAGVVNVVAGDMRVDGTGGLLTGVASSSEAEATGRAGSMGVAVTGTLELVRAGTLTVASNSAADSGMLNVEAGRLVVREGGEITGRTGAGRGGAVVVQAGSILLQGDGQRLAGTGITNDTTGAGAAGDVKVIARDTLTVRDGARISSNSSSSGHGGTVQVAAKEMTLDDNRAAASDAAGVVAAATGTGNAGRIQVDVAGTLSMAGGSQISTNTRGAGAAGDVSISVGNLLIDDGRNTRQVTGIGSVSFARSGPAGNVRVNATGAVTLLRGAKITSDTGSGANAGSVVLEAQDITVDGLLEDGTGGIATFVSSDSLRGATGAAGRVSVTATRSLHLRGGGVISSRALAEGDAGVINVVAGDMRVDGTGGLLTGVASNSDVEATGRAGSIGVEVAGTLELLRGGILTVASDSNADSGMLNVAAGRLVAREGGEVTGRTAGAGRGGAVVVQAGSILLQGDPAAASLRTGISNDTAGSGAAGEVKVVAREMLTVRDGAQISSNTSSSGNGGTVQISARDVTLDDNRPTAAVAAGVLATATGTGNAGRIVVEVEGTLAFAGGSQMSTNTRGAGAAGDISVTAGNVLIDDSRNTAQVTGIGSVSFARSGPAGNVRVNATEGITLLRGAKITSDTGSASAAGNVTLVARDITIDGLLEDSSGGIATLVSSDSLRRAGGAAGTVSVTATRNLLLRGGGAISSRTFSTGDAGSITVGAGAMRVDGGGVAAVTGVASSSEPEASGHAGAVRVQVDGLLALERGGQLASGTATAGRGGSIDVTVGRLDVDGAGAAPTRSTGLLVQAEQGSTGAAGSVAVTAREDIVLRQGGVVASSTFGAGAAGSVTLKAARVRIDGQGSTLATGALSEAQAGSTGDAGSVAVTASEELQVANAGRISSSTAARGAGGAVTVEAGLLRMQRGLIAAQAGSASTGQTGNVSIAGIHGVEMRDQSRISIQNDATVADPSAIQPSMVRLVAPQVLLQDSSITAAATGNVAASGVDIAFNGALRMQRSSITTASNLGDGGPVRVEGGLALSLDRSQISTSVAGQQGNGGNIQVKADALAMRTAFIQANTAARNASGGNVRIDTRVLTPSGASLFVGGSTAHAFAEGVFGFNVIQAAAPTGLSGAIEISSPVLDLSGTLAEMTVRQQVPVTLAGSPCGARTGSAIVRGNRGSLPPSGRSMLEPAVQAAPAGPRAAARGETLLALKPGCDAELPR